MPVPRRSLLLAPLLIRPARARAETLPVGVPPDRRLSFDVLRNGAPIGTHILTFAAQDDRLTVTIAIKIAAGIGPVTLYRYEMQGAETWAGDQFIGLDTTTNDDGNRHRVSIRRTDAGLAVKSSGLPDSILPGATRPLTHWCAAALNGPLLSPQDGQPMKATITQAGTHAIPLANGQTVAAHGFNIATKTPVQDWYDAGSLWVSLHADAKDGSNIDYRRS